MPSFGLADAGLVLAYALVFIIPGLALGLAAGLRRWTAAAASPVLTYGLTAVTGQVCTLLDVDFGPVAMLGVIVLTTIVALVLRFGLPFFRKGRERASAETGSTEGDRLEARSSNAAIVVGILAGALLGAVTVITAMGRIDAINQRWDAVFHSSAIAFTLSQKDADPGALTAVVGYDSVFYPNLYHSLSAIVGHLTGASVPALIGAQLMLVAGVAGLGLAGLVRSQTRRVVLAALSPFLLAMFSGFPYDILLWGPVWAFAAGLALMPGFLLLFKDALEQRTLRVVFVTGIGAAGVLGTHVAIALTAAVFIGAYLTFRWWSRREHIRLDLLVGAGVLVTTCVVAPVYVLGSFVSSSSVYETPWDWPPVATPGAALGSLLSLSQQAPFPQYWLVALMVVGAFAIKRLRSMWWWFAATGSFIVLYVMAAAYNSPMTEALTLPWWNDRYRLAAIVNVGLVVLAAHGLMILGERLVVTVKRISPTKWRLTHRRAMAASLAFLLLALGVLSNSFYQPRNSANLAAGFRPAPTVTAEEQEAMHVLANMVRPGEQVMNDPNDGSTWMWPIAGVQPVLGQIVYAYGYENLSSDIRLLLESFRCLDSDPAVRKVLAERNVTHVFLGVGFVTNDFSRIEGLRNLSTVESLDLVYNQNEIRIYEIDPVPLQTDPVGMCDLSNS